MAGGALFRDDVKAQNTDRPCPKSAAQDQDEQQAVTFLVKLRV